MKAKIRCAAILSKAISPAPVLVATFRGGVTYVLLPDDVRWELLRWFRSAEAVLPWPDRAKPREFPELVREHALDCETGAVLDDDLASRAGSWINGEALWVRVERTERTEHTSVAAVIAAVLRAWQAEAGHATFGVIAAPSHSALWGARAILVAARTIDPSIQVPDNEGHWPIAAGCEPKPEVCNAR